VFRKFQASVASPSQSRAPSAEIYRSRSPNHDLFIALPSSSRTPFPHISPMFFTVAATTLLVVGYLLFKRSQTTRKLPPGPPAEPILGHLRIFPKTDPGKTFYEWSKLYGKLSSR
jgi:hypothetical protein